MLGTTRPFAAFIASVATFALAAIDALLASAATDASADTTALVLRPHPGDKRATLSSSLSTAPGSPWRHLGALALGHPGVLAKARDERSD